MKALFVLSLHLISLSLQTATAAEKDKPASLAPATEQLKRVRFVPGSAPMKGSSDFKGASCTGLVPGPRKGELWLQAHADVGDDFPVIDEKGVTLFEVLLKAGDDDHLVLEIHTKEGKQKIDLQRDKAGAVTVAGIKYDLSYPSVSVAAAPNAKPTTNKAMLMVTRRL